MLQFATEGDVKHAMCLTVDEIIKSLELNGYPANNTLDIREATFVGYDDGDFIYNVKYPAGVEMISDRVYVRYMRKQDGTPDGGYEFYGDF